MSSAITVSHLYKEYPQFLLNDVSFDIKEGYITGFIGPNGSGKTTSIKSILSFIKANKGEVFMLGDKVYSTQDIGVVMDSINFVKEWKMCDVEKVCSLFYKHWNRTQFYDYLNQFRIHESLAVEQLSRGMSVKLMIAIALSHEARLLILDEPTSGLDPVAREEICNLLQDFVSDEKHTVLFSTHITSDLESIADYIVFILNGKIVYSGTKDNLLESYRLIKGGLEDLKQFDEGELVGLKKNNHGFEALIATSTRVDLEDFIVETASLEQLIIFFNREA